MAIVDLDNIGADEGILNLFNYLSYDEMDEFFELAKKFIKKKPLEFEVLFLEKKNVVEEKRKN